MTAEFSYRRSAACCLGLILTLVGCRAQPIGLTAVSVSAIASQPSSSDAGLAVDASGELLLSWIGGDTSDLALYVARSADSGRTWSAGVRVAGGAGAPGEVHPHGESSPRLVAGPAERIAITWANSIPVTTRKWPAAMIRLSQSTDGGRSWSPPVTLNDDTTGALVSHQFHGAAWSGDSGLEVAWLDERGTGGVPGPADTAGAADPHGHGESEPDATIYLASSPDFGRTWTANRPLWGAACPCCRVSLARGADGRVLSAWRKHFPGDVRDVVVAPLDADSSLVRRVHADEWVYPGCPHTGPAVAVDATGTHIVWY
ncbi:MAG: sialidase family protein, partial [Gemmatimonadales bacterium]